MADKERKWVAYKEDMQTKVAEGNTPEEAAEKAHKKGVENPVIDVLNEEPCSFLL